VDSDDQAGGSVSLETSSNPSGEFELQALRAHVRDGAEEGGAVLFHGGKDT